MQGMLAHKVEKQWTTGRDPKVPTSNKTTSTPPLSKQFQLPPESVRLKLPGSSEQSTPPSSLKGRTPDITGQPSRPAVGKNVPLRTTEPPHESKARERIVHEKARQNNSELKLDDGVHGIAVEGTGKNRGHYFCSTECHLLHDKLDAMLEVLPKDHPSRKDLAHLRDQIRRTTKDLKEGAITDEEADNLSKAYTIVLRNHADDPAIRQLLEMSPKEMTTHSAEIKRAIELGLGVRGREEITVKGSGVEEIEEILANLV
jgi:hypothetical protein